MQAAHRIHIVGAGNIGCLVAHALRSIVRPPDVTLCFRNHAQKKRFWGSNDTIDILRHGVWTSRAGFDSIVADRPDIAQSPNASLSNPFLQQKDAKDTSIIKHMIVTTKAYQSVGALRPYQYRLTKESTIMFIQNGMGTMEEVNEQLFPRPETRPNMVLATTSHGVHPSVVPHKILQKGFGTLSMGVVPRGGETPETKAPALDTLQPSTKVLISTMLQCTELFPLHVSYPELISLQLEKLAVNCVINPLTTVFDCYNKDLLYNDAVSKLTRLIVFEFSKVVGAMSEVADLSSRELRFAPDRLEKLVIQVARRTGDNVSSMLQDVRLGRRTEIDYINGFVVDRGAQLGIPCAVNFTLREMVRAKQRISSDKLELDAPFKI